MSETLKLNALMVGDWVMYNPNVFIVFENEFDLSIDLDIISLFKN